MCVICIMLKGLYGLRLIEFRVYIIFFMSYGLHCSLNIMVNVG